MTPALTLIALTWIGSIVAGYVLGKLKGHVSAGIILTVILGPLGLVIFACLARTYPVMPASGPPSPVPSLQASRQKLAELTCFYRMRVRSLSDEPRSSWA